MWQRCQLKWKQSNNTWSLQHLKMTFSSPEGSQRNIPTNKDRLYEWSQSLAGCLHHISLIEDRGCCSADLLLSSWSMCGHSVSSYDLLSWLVRGFFCTLLDIFWWCWYWRSNLFSAWVKAVWQPSSQPSFCFCNYQICSLVMHLCSVLNAKGLLYIDRLLHSPRDESPLQISSRRHSPCVSYNTTVLETKLAIYPSYDGNQLTPPIHESLSINNTQFYTVYWSCILGEFYEIQAIKCFHISRLTCSESTFSKNTETGVWKRQFTTSLQSVNIKPDTLTDWNE